MPPVIFIGLGLNDEKGISLEGLEEARRADRVFAEFYTNSMPNLKMNQLEKLVGKRILVLTRMQLEDEEGRRVLEAAEKEKVAFLVPGDPMIATTHLSLRLALAKKGLDSRLIHGPSIISAACGATGLQNYKFGKSVTLPQEEGQVPGSVFDVLTENRTRGLHTLLLLDVKPELGRQMTIENALDRLTSAAPHVSDWLAVGIARLGCPDQQVKASKIRTLSTWSFGGAPHSLVFPGKLHFMEVEALKIFCGATDRDVEASF